MTADSPFAPVHSRQSFLETLGVGEALRRLDSGLGAREPFLIVTGDPGTGKTALAHEMVARWGPRVAAAFLVYPALTSAELLEEILRRLGADPPEGASRPKLVACLERALAEIMSPDQVAIIVVDDAHRMSAELLEELRLLVIAAQHAGRPIEVMLIGLPALEARLDEPALAALRQRVAVRVKLDALSPSETERYVQHRVTAAGGDGAGLFPSRTCREIETQTNGVPRQINMLAAEALSIAREAGQAAVEPEHVRSAAATLRGVAPVRAEKPPVAARPRPKPPVVATPPPLVAGPMPPVVATPAPPAVETPAPPAAAMPAPPAVAAPVHSEAPPIAPPAKPMPVMAAPPTPAPPAVAEPLAEIESPALTEEFATPLPPATQDPREWVARFVGDKGPLQIGSRAVSEPTWVPDPPDPPAAEAPVPAETPPPRRKPTSGAPSRSRPERRIDLRLVTSAALASIVVFGVIALVLRAGNLARDRAGQANGVTTTAASADSAETASPRGSKSASRSTRGASTTGAATRSPESSNKRSKRPYTLEVGRYGDFDRALDARERMQALTGFEGWVVATDEDGVEKYRVVLGAYRSHERATAAADMLIKSRTLSKVTVVPLPPQHLRQ